jgi:DUF4097 and DUF4098 domain-containing protein YvlB
MSTNLKTFPTGGRWARAAVLALVALGIPALASAEAKETERVEKTVPFPSGGTLKLKNFSGHVEITGETRSDVSIVAVRKATRERLDHIKMAVETSGSTVSIEANKKDGQWREKNENVVETAFTIKVPASANLDIDVFSSPVTVTGVSGKHHVHGFSSDLHLDRSTGSVDAETFSGAIYLAPAAWAADQSISAKTFSGDIDVKLPAQAGGSVEFDSFSGDMKADVPLMLKSKSKRSLRATLDGGQGELYFKTFSGDVHIGK